MDKIKNIGIFGGTFNPIHNTHIYIANEFVKQVNLHYCYFVPTYISPFKINNTEQSNTKHRLKMLELAINNNPKFKIDIYEISNKKISYTINTVKYFRNKYKNDKLFLLIGSDQARKFNQWKNWEEILELAQLYIVRRGIDSDDKHIINKMFPKSEKPIWLDINPSDLSSSQIRDMIKIGNSVSDLIPKKVEEYIRSRKLYL